MGYSFRLAARVPLYVPSHRQDSTHHSLCYTSLGELAGMRNSSVGPPQGTDCKSDSTITPLTTNRVLNINSIFIHKCNGLTPTCRSLMVRWVVGSILHGVDPLSYFSFQPVLHDWCNKGRGMCYPVCGMVHIKEPLLLIDKSSLCGGSGFPFSLSEWSITICLTPYNRR